jgi:hypothetical protein
MTDELGSLSAPVPRDGAGARLLLDEDRLDELETFSVDDDTPDKARVALPARDVRDLVRLIPCLRAALELRDMVVSRSDYSVSPALQSVVLRFDAERGA